MNSWNPLIGFSRSFGFLQANPFCGGGRYLGLLAECFERAVMELVWSLVCCSVSMIIVDSASIRVPNRTDDDTNPGEVEEAHIVYQMVTYVAETVDEKIQYFTELHSPKYSRNKNRGLVHPLLVLGICNSSKSYVSIIAVEGPNCQSLFWEPIMDIKQQQNQQKMNESIPRHFSMDDRVSNNFQKYKSFTEHLVKVALI